jgi:sulfite exporter TauE/SafE
MSPLVPAIQIVSGTLAPASTDAGGFLGGLGSGADLLLFFIVGGLAGAHCLGMCGPLVSTYADRITAQRGSKEGRITVFDVRQHALFNLGRTVGYATVGGILGLAGAFVVGTAARLDPLAAPVRGAIGIAVGAFIVSAGAGYLVSGTTHATTLTGVPGLGPVFTRLTRALTSTVDRAAGSVRIAGLGTVHALLPCPILYPAYLYAFAIGDPVRGALALGVLGLGTIPTLFAYGLTIGSLSVRSRTLLHRAMGVAFLLLGYLPLAHGLMLFGIELPYPDVPFYQPLSP